MSTLEVPANTVVVDCAARAITFRDARNRPVQVLFGEPRARSLDRFLLVCGVATAQDLYGGGGSPSSWAGVNDDVLLAVARHLGWKGRLGSIHTYWSDFAKGRRIRVRLYEEPGRTASEPEIAGELFQYRDGFFLGPRSSVSKGMFAYCTVTGCACDDCEQLRSFIQESHGTRATGLRHEAEEQIPVPPRARRVDDVSRAQDVRIEMWAMRRVGGEVAQLLVRNDMTYAVSFSQNARLTFWNLARPRSLEQLALSPPLCEKPLCPVAPDRILVFSASLADLYSVPDGRQCWTSKLRTEVRWVWGGHLTPDQRHLLLIVDDLTIWILDAHTGATQQKDTGIADSSKGLGATIVDALHCVSDLVPNSRVLTLGLLGSHDEAFVMTWDISDSGSGWYAEVPGGMIDDVKVSPDSSLVACGCSDGNTRILELGSGRVATTLNGNGTPITALSWASRDGVLLTGDKHGLLTLWNVRSSQRLAVREGYPTLSVLSSISPDGRFAYGTRSGHVGIMTITDINADPPVSTGARP